jgi:PAS domain S-box-containing protein
MNNNPLKLINITDLLSYAVNIKLTIKPDLRILKVFARLEGDAQNQDYPQFEGKLLTECANLDLVRQIKHLIIQADEEKAPQNGTIILSSLNNSKVYFDVMPISSHLFYIFIQRQQTQAIDFQYQFMKELFISLSSLGTLEDGANLLVSNLNKLDPTNMYGIFLFDEQNSLIHQKFKDGSLIILTNQLLNFIKSPQNWTSLKHSIPIFFPKKEIMQLFEDPALNIFTSIGAFPILFEGQLLGCYFVFTQSEFNTTMQTFLEDFSSQSGIILSSIREFQNITRMNVLMETILDSLDLNFFVVTSAGTPVYYSAIFRETLGLAPRIDRTQNILNFIEPHQKEIFSQLLQQSSSTFSSKTNIIFISSQGEKTNLPIRVRNLPMGDEMLYFGNVLVDEEVFKVPTQELIDILARLPYPVFVVNELSHQISVANVCASEIFNVSAGDIPGKNFMDLFSPSENIRLIEKIKTGGLRHLGSDQIWTLEKSDQTQLKTRILINPINYQKEKSLLIILHEIPTELDTFLIRESQSTYQSIHDHQYLCKLTPDGILTHANQAYCDMTGKPINKILGMPLQENIFIEDYEAVFNHLSQLSPEQPVRKNINRLVNQSGEIRWVEWVDTGIFVDGKLVEIDAVGVDITQKYKQDLLKESMEQRYQALVENLPFVITVHHTDSLYPIYVSPQIQEITGYNQEEMYSNPEKLFNLIHPDDREMFEGNVQEVQKYKDPAPLEIRIQSKEGDIRWVEFSGTNIQLSDQTSLLQSVFRDVTARRKAREKLQYYSRFEKLIIEFSLRFMNAEENKMSELINYVIEELGKFMQVDRSYVFNLDHRTQTMSNTFEWCNQGIPSAMDDLQNVPFSIFPWWMEHLQQNLNITLDDIEEMPFTSEAERETFISQGIKSLLVVPIFYKGKAQGFIGFDMVNNYTHWEPEAINLLRIVSTMITSTFKKFFEKTNP